MTDQIAGRVLDVAITADGSKKGAAEFTRSIDDIKRSAQGMEQQNRRLSDSFGSVGSAAATLKTVFAGVAASALTSTLIAITKSAIDAADRINDLSKRTGVAVEALSGFAYVAKLSGTDVESFAGSLSKMNRTLAQAASGNQTAQRAFDQLGLSFKELKTLTPEEQFLTIADNISQLRDESDKTKAAMDIFGRSGAALIPVFEGGADAIRDMLDEADKLGATFSAEEAAKIARFNDEIDKLSFFLQGLARDGFLAVYDAATDFYKIMTETEVTLGTFSQKVALVTLALSGPAGLVGALTLARQQSKMLAEQEKADQSFWEQKSKALGYTTEIKFADAEATDKQARSLKTYSSEAKKAAKDAADADAEFRAVLKDVKGRFDDQVADEQERRLKELANAAAKQAEAMMKPFEHAFERVQDALADMFVEGKFSFQSLADVAKRLAAEVAAAWLIRPVIGTMTSSMFGHMGAGSAGGGGGLDTMGLASGASSGISALMKGLNTPIINPGIAFDIGKMLGLSGGATGALQSGLANFTPGAGLASFGGNFLANAIFGGDRGMGSSIGGTLGGIAGTFVGGPIGGAIGSFLGNAIGGLFGPGKPNPASTFGGSVGKNNALKVGFDSKHMDTSAAEGLAAAVGQITQSLLAAGINLAKQEIHGGIDENRFGGGFFGIGGLDNIISFDPNNEDSLNNALAKLAIELTKTADVVNQDVLKALKNIQTEGRTIDEVISDIAFAGNFDKMFTRVEVLNQYDQATQELNKIYIDAIDTARRLGFEEERITEMRQRGIDRMREIAQGEAMEFYANQIAIHEQTIANYQEQRDAFADTAEKWRGFIKDIDDFKNSLRLDRSLGLTNPLTRRNEAMALVESTLARVRGGDEGALSQLQEVSQDALNASREYYNSSEDYFKDAERINAALEDAQNYARGQLSAAERELVRLDTMLDVDKRQLQTMVDILATLQASLSLGAGGRLPGTSLPDNVLLRSGEVASQLDGINSLNGISERQVRQFKTLAGYSFLGSPYSTFADFARANPAAGSIFNDLVARAGGKTQQFAGGGTMPYSGWAMTGESGRELAYFPSGTQVYNAEQTRAIFRPSNDNSGVIAQAIEMAISRYAQQSAMETMEINKRLESSNRRLNDVARGLDRVTSKRERKRK